MNSWEQDLASDPYAILVFGVSPEERPDNNPVEEVEPAYCLHPVPRDAGDWDHFRRNGRVALVVPRATGSDSS